MFVKTNHPIALDSPDHIYPWGTMRDNSTNPNFIQEIENYFGNKKINFLDIGCSGGQLAVDFHNRGHVSVGIEGSDYSVRHKRANWPLYHNRVLFTCDAAKPYQIVDDFNNEIKFDCITSWETIEHIAPEQHDIFFTNIVNHMNEQSIFVGSIATGPDNRSVIDENGEWVELHQSVFAKDFWRNEILSKYFIVKDYPFSYTNAVRGGDNDMSYLVLLTKK